MSELRDGKFIVRMDRHTGLVPVVGDELVLPGGTHVAVIKRKLVTIPDNVNEQIWVKTVELDVEVIT